MSEKKRYRVTWEIVVDVEAENEDEALEAAELIVWPDREVLNITVAEVTK